MCRFLSKYQDLSNIIHIHFDKCFSYIYLKLSNRYSEIRLIKLIRRIPAQGAKFPSLLDQGMKEAQPKQKLLKYHWFIARVKECRVRNWVVEIGSKEVGF